MRLMAVTLCMLVAGCTARAPTAVPVATEAAAALPVADPGPEALIVRMFVDDAADPAVVIRLAALDNGTEVEPFEGWVVVTMKPQPDSDREWMPRVWMEYVEEDKFVTENPDLPYYELQGEADHLQWGERVTVEAEANLPDGRVVYGYYNRTL